MQARIRERTLRGLTTITRGKPCSLLASPINLASKRAFASFSAGSAAPDLYPLFPEPAGHGFDRFFAT